MLKTETLNKLRINITKVLNFLHNKGITSYSNQESKDYFICMEYIILCDFNYNLDKVSEFATELQLYFKGKGYKNLKILQNLVLMIY